MQAVVSVTKASMPPVPPELPSGRFVVLDGLRGAFLVCMTLGHLHLAGEILLQKLHPATVSFVDAAAGFVTLSGVVTGLVYGRLMRRDGFGAGSRRLLQRALVVYGWAAGLVLALVLMAQTAPYPGQPWGEWLGPVLHPTAGSLLAAVLLIQHVELADILAQYVVYLLAAPLVVAACLRGRTVWVLAASALVWLAVQLGGSAPVTAALRAGLEPLGSDLRLPEAFNLGGWQLLFVAGLAIGVATVRHGPGAWRRRARLDSPWLLALCLVLAAALAGLRVAEELELLTANWTAGVALLAGKPRLGPLVVLNVAVVSWLLAWLTMAAPTSARVLERRAGELARRVLAWPYLTLLGRHALAVYAWHVLVVYALEWIDAAVGHVREPWRSADVLLAFALLAVPPLILERRRAGAPRLATSAPPL